MNPVRMCSGRILWDTYFIGSWIKTKCDQPLIVRLINIQTGLVHEINGEINISIVSEGKLDRVYGCHYPTCAQDTRLCEPEDSGEVG